ncbi:helix-turn-helix domain-containing protein [Flavobacterium marginilacus]|uniref:helix-turn-helix domain-containing protein n=1 Tax=Flavobacterium marginilacus TaxID=3003256 RepID=UPI00248F0131|nr:helix-turn-helix transcriptional regulator [Flavobacterium marginilacus]
MEQKSYYKNWYALTDNAIVETLCKSIKQMRLNRNISQEELSERSGVNRITISRMETGKAINLMTLIQLLRALEKLELLNYLNEEPEISPMMVMEAQKKLRKKASPTSRNSNSNEYGL